MIINQFQIMGFINPVLNFAILEKINGKTLQANSADPFPLFQAFL